MSLALDPQQASLRLGADSVLDRVLYQGLKRKRRQTAAERLGLDALFDPEPLAEPQALQRKIILNEVQFFRKRDVFVLSSGDERVSQQRSEFFQRIFGGLRIMPDQGHQRMECVEKKVRVELRA